MNWKALAIQITAVNLLAWFLLEFWIARYSGGVAEIGAAIMILVHLVGYYMIVTKSKKKDPNQKITPKDCPGHDWQAHPNEYTHNHIELCMICGAKRKNEEKDISRVQ